LLSKARYLGSERTLIYVLEMEGKSVGDAEFVTEAKKDWSQQNIFCFFLKKKRRKVFAKRLLPKMFWHEGEKFFIFEFFVAGEV